LWTCLAGLGRLCFQATVLKKVGAVAVTVVPVSLLAGLGLPAFVATVVLAAVLVVAVLVVAVTGLACWIISDDQRSERVVRLLIAVRVCAEVAVPTPVAAGTATQARRCLRWPWRHAPGA
jgi:choline-glycine betaine transporter